MSRKSHRASMVLFGLVFAAGAGGCDWVQQQIAKNNAGGGGGGGAAGQASPAQTTGQSDAIAALPRQAGWTISAAPVIKVGDLRDKGVWNDPSVLKTPTGYVMYLSSSSGKEIFKPPVLPYRAVSADGVSWRLEPKTPLLDVKGTPYKSIETPSVVLHRGVYHMYYTGVFPDGQVPTMAIGHATSRDGVTWTKDSRPAVISATGKVSDWNGFLVAEPGAVVFNDKIYLYFTAMGGRAGGNPPQVQVIALAISEDGTTFDAPRAVFGQTDLYPASKGFVGYSTPAAAVYDGQVHVFCNVAHYNKAADPQWSQAALHHAVSADGVNNFRQDDIPILTRNHMGYPGGEVGGPSVLFEGDTLKMWFLGHAGAKGFMPEVIGTGKTSKFGIYLATTSADRFKAGAR